MKYILVTGGVISGVGKGVIASSFGTLLKSCGLDVTSIKIDPYINIDAGTFSPYEHECGGLWADKAQGTKPRLESPIINGRSSNVLLVHHHNDQQS
ncbi:hypothetical protein ACLKA6_011243 [Drosophila palustris]